MFYKDNEELLPVAYVKNSKAKEILIPGKYIVQVIFRNDEER